MVRLPSLSYETMEQVLQQLKLLEIGLAAQVDQNPSDLRLVHQWCEAYRDLETVERASSYVKRI